MFCKNCGNPVSDNASFCNNCGNKIEHMQEHKSNVCLACGNALNENTRFCKNCGSSTAKESIKSEYPAQQAFQSHSSMSETNSSIVAKTAFNSRQVSGGISGNVNSGKKNMAATSGKKKKSRFFKTVMATIVVVAALFVLVIIFADNDEGKIDKSSFLIIGEQIGLAQVESLDGVIMEAKEGIKIDLSCTTGIAAPDVTLCKVETDIGKKINASVAAYDIKVSGNSSFSIPIEITLPYDSGYIENGEVIENCVTAAYYNEESKEWEPMFCHVNEKSGNVTIVTDHLSSYSVFTFKNVQSRLAKIEYNIMAPLPSDNSKAYEVFDELLAKKGKPGSACLKFGIDLAGDAVNLSNFSGLYESVNDTAAAGGASSMFSTINSYMSNLGKALTVYSVASDLYNGKIETANYTAMKYVAGENIAWLSPIAAVGVFAIDYSLTAFAESVFGDRKELFVQAYHKYYQEKYPNITAHLYSVFYEAYLRYKNGEIFDLKQELDNELKSFVREFWDNPQNVYIYLSEVIKGSPWGGDGYLSAELEKDIAEAYYNEIIKYRVPAIVKKLSNEIKYKCYSDYINAQEKLTDYLNKVVAFKIYEERASDDAPYQYAKYIVRINTNSSENGTIRGWTGKMDNTGKAETSFTRLGYILAGAPASVSIYEPGDNPDNATPVKTVNFDFSDRIEIKILSNLEAEGDLEGEIAGTTDGPIIAGVTYVGHYKYDDGRSSVSFKINFQQVNSQISGTITDADGSKATFTGSINGNRVEFVKKYSGSNQNSVKYVGTIDLDSNKLEGEWSIDNITTGVFSIDLDTET